MFSAFPADMLPYDPATTITLQPADVTALLGVLPTGALPIAAVGGPLQRGSVIWSAPAGDSVVGARQQYGQGTVTVLGIDPAIAWLAGSIAEDTIWARAVPTAAAWSDAQLPSDDQFLVNALGQLPAVQLPGGTQLLLLIVAYVAAIGPLNYFVLRRRDRREWAWLTMPVIIAVFGVGSYGIGIAQKGGDVIVNELVIVEGAVGSERGEADVHVGVFSPGRSTYDLRVGEAPLLSGTASDGGQRPDRPLDVVLGDPATLRGFGVGFGALRAFRAQTAVDTPRLDADFNLVENALAGTLTNSSAIALEDVSIVYAGAARILGDMAPGESSTVSVAPRDRVDFDESVATQLYPFGGGPRSDERLTVIRRTLIQHLAGGFDTFEFGGGFGRPPAQRPDGASSVFGGGPVVLAWVRGGLLDISAASAAQRVGETLYVLPAHVALAGHVVFSGGVLEPTVESIESDEGFKTANVYSLTRGTLSVGYRPLAFDGQFAVSSLGLRLGMEAAAAPSATGTQLQPLAAAEQPASDAPLATSPRPDEGSPEVPRVQLFDHIADSWVEFEPISFSTSYQIVDPQRYVDAAGAFRIRFVCRTDDYLQFALSARVEGTIE